MEEEKKEAVDGVQGLMDAVASEQSSSEIDSTEARELEQAKRDKEA